MATMVKQPVTFISSFSVSFPICTILQESLWCNGLKIDDDVYIFLLNVSKQLNQGNVITDISRKKNLRTVGRRAERFCSAFWDGLAFQTGNAILLLVTKIHHNKTFNIWV